MKRSRSWKGTLTVSAVMFFCFFSGLATAAPEDFHYMVSPSSCQPENESSAETLDYINGVWRGNGRLVCPINFSGNRPGSIQLIQLWYLDSRKLIHSQPEPATWGVSVEFNERQRNVGGYKTLQTLFSTYGTGEDGQPNGHKYGLTTGYPNANLAKVPEFGHNYFLRVWLQQDAYGSKAAFTGFEIRFNN